MAKRLTREQKREQALVNIMNKMFEIAGHNVTFEDIKGRTDAWYCEWTMTMAQSDEWRKWGADYLRKVLKINKASAEKEMTWINLQYGLKYSDYEQYGK